MSRFEECWDRVDRADAHAKTLVDACESLLGDRSYTVVAELRNKRNGSLVIKPTKMFDRQIAFELGEYFYQLRAALDSAMWKTYEALGFSIPSANEKQLYFPIIGKSGRFNKATFHFVNLLDELRRWIRSIQPCFAHEYPSDSDEAVLAETLRVINECASFDRHRKLHIVGAYVTRSTATVRVRPDTAEIVNLRHITTGDYFKGEFTVAEFTVRGWTPETEIAGEGQFAVTVSVNEILKTMGELLGNQFRTMVNNIRVVIQKFDSMIE